MLKRGTFLLILFILPVLAQAQFSLAVQENGQSFSVANGGQLTLNAPGVGQPVIATVTATYLGTATATFLSGVQFLGSTNFGGGTSGTALQPGQSISFPVTYNPSSVTQALGQLVWSYTQTGGSGGAITLNLVGNAANLVVGQLISGSFAAISSGGTIQFPTTLLNSTTSVATIIIVNSGSGPGTINSVSSSNGAFVVQGVPLLPLTLNSNAQLTLTVQFVPTSAGSATGSLQMSFSSGPFFATLSGTGVTNILQYQLTQNGVTSSLTSGQTIAFAGTNVGSKSQAVIQFQNPESVPLIINALAISGTGFAITDAPFLPVTIPPQQTNSITVTFAPTLPGALTGRLQIGSDTFQLSGTGLAPLLQISYSSSGAAPVIVTAPGPITFPAVAVGLSTSIQITITNIGTVADQIGSIGLGGTTNIFQTIGLPSLPLQLAPNASVSFAVSFTPQSIGPATTTLLVDSSSITLTGLGTAPPALPSFSFTGVSGTVQPFQQPSIGLSLGSAYPLNLQGTLTLSQATSYFFADPSVQFSSGGLSVAFSIPANTTQAIFPNGAAQIQFQAGTVASTISITPAFQVGTASVTPANPPVLQVKVPAAAPTELSVTVSALTFTSFKITDNRFYTKRKLDHLTFQLNPTSGSKLAATSITTDVSGASRQFFQTALAVSTGGQFAVDIPFTLTNGTAGATTNLTQSIGSIAVTAVNDIGASNTLQVVLP